MGKSRRLRVAILGASGYTGFELVRLLACHPKAKICALIATTHIGEPSSIIFPQLYGLHLPNLASFDMIDWSEIDVIFSALPHGAIQELIICLPNHLKIIDLSADFRFSDLRTYDNWYHTPHKAPALQQQVIYGLPEFTRSAIRSARIVACPGCYPTSILLPLAPLLEQELISCEDIIVDSKSGVSGAGRSTKKESLFCEISDSIYAYNIAGHRHIPEVEQGLCKAASQKVVIRFTPHLVPMNRGIFSTLYIRLKGQKTESDLRTFLSSYYSKEPFVHVLPKGVMPRTHYVRGSNFCLIGVFPGRVSGQVILCTVIDNLVKGSSGQAVQNFNLMTGQSESCGLEQLPLLP